MADVSYVPGPLTAVVGGRWQALTELAEAVYANVFPSVAEAVSWLLA